MAEIEKDTEKSHPYGGGNRNAIAYGLLQGAGYNTAGMSPSEAWELVTQLNLMESKRWKRTEEDKKEIKEKNKALSTAGKDKKSLEVEAGKYANVVNFGNASNIAAIDDAITTVSDLIKEYSLKKLETMRIKSLSTGTMASANEITLNIGDKITRNPNAAYRICVESYNKNLETTIEDLEKCVANAKNPKAYLRFQASLDNMKEMNKYSRHNVVYQGEEMKSVITHEMAHVIAGQNFGFASYGAGNKPLNLIEKSFKESKQNGDIYKISAYAAKDADEFWAECFTMYKMGKEQMPEKIKSMVEGVLNNHVKKQN